MQDFPSNSQKAKAADVQKEKLTPVTSATTRARKTGIGQKFKRTFFAGSGKDAATAMVQDIVVPSIRDLFHNAAQGWLEQLFYGDRMTGRRRPSSIITSNQPTGSVNYAGMSSGAQTKASQQRTISQASRARHNFQDIVIDSQREANEVLDRMYEILSRQGEVTVAELYTLTNIRPEHTDIKFGWIDLQGSRAVRLGQGGYLLNLPDPVVLR